MRIKLLTIWLLLLMPTVSWGTTYYLDAVYGLDSNPGTEADPWKTMVKVETSSGSGDTIYIKNMNSDMTGVDWPEGRIYYATTVKQWGITWTFDDDYRVGQYANRDMWAIGPINITSIEPAYAVVDSPTRNGFVFNNRIINGSMINPLVANLHGYTNSTDSFDAGVCVNSNVSPANPLVITISVIPIRSLVSTIATEVVPDKEDGSIRIGEQHLQTAAILTIITSVPNEDAFRPYYVGDSKSAEIRASSINLVTTPLGNLTPTANAPTFEWAENEVKRVWLHHMPESPSWWGPFMMAIDNAPSYYGREIAITMSEVTLLLNTSTVHDKTELMHYVVQNGIDVWGVVSNNHLTYRNNGGGQNGRLVSVAIAAHLLNHASMKEMLTRAGQFCYTEVDGDGWQYWPDRDTPDYVHFGELDQTHYVTHVEVCMTQDSPAEGTTFDNDDYKACFGIGHELYNHPYLGTTWASDDWRPDVRNEPFVSYDMTDIDLPEYGLRHSNFPVLNNKDWEASSYRGVSGCTFPGTALVAHIMGMTDLYNHPAFFDYADRYMTTIATYPLDSSWRVGTNSPGVFTTEMWDEYRGDYSPIWNGARYIIGVP